MWKRENGGNITSTLCAPWYKARSHEVQLWQWGRPRGGSGLHRGSTVDVLWRRYRDSVLRKPDPQVRKEGNKQTQSAISPAAAHCQVSDNYYPETRIVGTVFAYFTDVNQYVQSFDI